MCVFVCVYGGACVRGGGGVLWSTKGATGVGANILNEFYA